MRQKGKTEQNKEKAREMHTWNEYNIDYHY